MDVSLAIIGAPGLFESDALSYLTKTINITPTFGSNLITNGDFTAWSGSPSHPDGWTVTETPPAVEVTEVGTGESHGGAGTGSCNLYNNAGDASRPRIQQVVLTANKFYAVDFDISAQSGTLQTVPGTFCDHPTVPATHDIHADATVFQIRSSTNSDVTIDNVSVKEISNEAQLFNLGYFFGDYTISPTVPDTAYIAGMYACYEDANNFLRVFIHPQNDSLKITLQKRVGGTYTLIDSYNTFVYVPGAELLLRVDENGNITVKYNGDDIITGVTDTGLRGTQGGAFLTNSAVTIPAFTWDARDYLSAPYDGGIDGVWYVSPAGGVGGPTRGSVANPMTLQQIASYDLVQPGHTVYLREGTYTDAGYSVTVDIAGTSGNLVTFQNYPGELVQLDLEIHAAGAYQRWLSPDYLFEIVGLTTNRQSTTENPPDIVGAHDGFLIEASYVEIINIRMKDFNGTGIEWFQTYQGGLVYGIHLIQTGWLAVIRLLHGPGIYTNYDQGGAVRTIQNSLFCNPFRHSLQLVSAGTNQVRDYLIEDATLVGPSFTSGTAAPTLPHDNIIVNRLSMWGTFPEIGASLTNQGDDFTLDGAIIGPAARPFSAKNLDALTVTNCKFEAAEADQLITNCPGATLTGNTYEVSTGLDYNLVPNTYAAAFAHLTVFNWDDDTSVTIDVSAWASDSETIRIHNPLLLNTGSAEYADVVVSGGNISVPMQAPDKAWTTPDPLGLDSSYTADHFPGTFGLFLLENLG